MKIEITRSGGFAGLTRTWSIEVSRTEAEERWLPLAEAEAGGTDAESGPGLQRDRFTYRIAIGYTEVHLSESRLDDPWRELIERARATDAASATPGSGVGGSVAEAPPEGIGGTDAGGRVPGSAPSPVTDPGKPEELL
ncbi:protealysin inhibitor emfourin [Arthrobacter sedimenti]|uniref:protealysin inhibitor emfourin n=1 Tax=Arthrobacter sedimenti TaxID=2694931 RepID=UPI000B34D2D2|nr:protealysin inhibitor emfourin [Arthrobacter sedimenti]OUM41825.1 hypothetical protein B8W73_09350 [Arthrobacter agilis]